MNMRLAEGVCCLRRYEDWNSVTMSVAATATIRAHAELLFAGLSPVKNFSSPSMNPSHFSLLHFRLGSSAAGSPQLNFRNVSVPLCSF